MSDNAIAINLWAPVLNGNEEEWPEFIEKFQAFLALKKCTEVIQTNFNSKLPVMEDEELDASTKLAKMKNAMMMAYATQCLSDASMLNTIFNIQAEHSNWLEKRVSCLTTWS